MKPLIIALIAICFTGCASEQHITPKEPTMQYGVDLNNYPTVNTNFDLQFDHDYDMVEKYGSVAYKAIGACYSKYLHELDGIDTSTEYGATVQDEMVAKVNKCTEETLSVYPVIPENERVKIKHNEIESDDISDMPVAPYDKNDPRYKELLETCTENNSVIPDETNRKEAVEFCISKSM